MALVCLCHGVNERRVCRAIDAGANTVAEIAEACAAGSCCFACHPTLDQLLAERTAVGVSAARGARLSIA